MNLYNWASRWGVSWEAITELREGMLNNTVTRPGATSEAGVSGRVRLEAAAHGNLLFRNNVGAMQDETGRVVRFGLCNESKAMNQKVKSSDLIGITSVLVTQQMVGQTVGIFTAIECKAPGWIYKGTAHEEAQRKFGEIILSHGGIFNFTT